MWKIKKQLLEEICNAAKNYYPNEFMCFLFGNKETIEEIVLLPNTSGKDFAQISPTVIPIDEQILGSLHSHPNGSARPSEADKQFFRRHKINAIIDGSYLPERVNFFNSKGEQIICHLE